MPTTEERLVDLETRMAAVEGTYTSTDQIIKLTSLYSGNHADLSAALDAAVAEITSLKTNIRALNANRFNKRYELKTEAPTLISGDTYELPTSYDPAALFLVFNVVVKVAESAITLGSISDVDPLSKRFDSSVPLVAGSRVIYFGRIPDLARPTFP